MMLLTSFDPYLQDFDRMVRRAFGWAGAGPDGSAWMPMDAIRRGGEVELRFDLPGAEPESFEVTADGGVLTVSARRAEELQPGDKPYIRERLTGSFVRRIRLAENVDAEKIEASYDRGVLTVRLPLAAPARPRKIEIKEGAEQEIAA
jgi:HSP20 family protein